MSFYKEDQWQAALVHAPMKEIISDYGFKSHNITLLPVIDENCNISEPFALWHEDHLFIFVKSYNKNTLKSNICVLKYDKNFSLLSNMVVLEEEWNLSHPYVFKHKGEIFMLPGAVDTEQLSLYRAVTFPEQWERVNSFNFPLSVTNGTLFHCGQRWWLFWAPTESVRKKHDTLHIAVAEELTGQWADMGIFLTDRGGAVPGGTPINLDGTVYLPVQQNRQTEGGGLRLLRFENFGLSRPLLIGGRSLDFPSSLAMEYPDGMRTLSAAGPVSLVDLKKETLSFTKPVKLLKMFLKRRAETFSEVFQLKSDH